MRELNQKQLWLLRMLFEEGIEEDEIQRFTKDNASNISRWKETNKRRRTGPLQSRLNKEIGEPEIKAEPAVLQSVEGERIQDEPSRDRRIKRKSKTN